MAKSQRTRIKRTPKRAVYERESIYKVLDCNFLCHVGIIHNNAPLVIPMMYGRKGNELYIHGASVSRLIKQLEKGVTLCVSVSNVSGLVLARSTFHHTLNYESVVVFGQGELVREKHKTQALKVISDHLIPHRWEEVRAPGLNELKATKVIRIGLEECSAKIRTGNTVDNVADYDLPIWAGVLPIVKTFGDPIPDPKMKMKIDIPKSVRCLAGAHKKHSDKK